MTYQELLIYWIKERYSVYQKKETGLPKPWSEDYIFQETYFCNVHRETDRVTKWIRREYSPFGNHRMFEYNIILARFINKIETLQSIGFVEEHDPKELESFLEGQAAAGFTIWGSAYIITTHGQRMGKVDYLCNQVLSDVAKGLESLRAACRGPSCRAASDALQRIDGIGSFLAAQVVADLKNTPGHPLYSAPDRATFVEAGPGSMRGLHWFFYHSSGTVTPRLFYLKFQMLRDYVDANWPEGVPRVDNQDLQNCLCEYDKYARIRTHSGRSKRRYNGL